MARKANGTGNVRQTPSGWEGSIRLHGRRYFVSGKTRTIVERKLAELRRQWAVGELVPPSRITVGEHLDDFLADCERSVRAKTVREYSSVVRLYLRPWFAHVQLQALSAPLISRAFGKLEREGRLSGKSTLNIFRVLSRALEVAVRWGRIGRNPCKSVEPPKATKPRPGLWSPEQARQFVAYLTAQDPCWHAAMAALLVGSGCRIGEVIGARWRDFDPESGRLTITGSRNWWGAEWHDADPKTAKGHRTITLPAFTVEMLRRWRSIQAEQRLGVGTTWQGADRIITLHNGESPKHRRCYDAWLRLADAADVPPSRLHDARHVHASLLLSDGMSVAEIGQRLGHASPSITLAVYSHVLNSDDSHVARSIESSLGA